jgi:RNA polymerase sigma-70 factor (ECF subfamily)
MDGEVEVRVYEQDAGEGTSRDRATTFATLAERHLDEAYGLARLIVGDTAEAEDATHDAFVAAWRGWRGLRDPARFDAWFGRILVNTCRNRVRRLRRRAVVDVSVLVAMADGARDPNLSLLDRAEIGPAFADLSREHREVVALRYYLDLPVDQIAYRLGIPDGTVKSRLHYALRALGGALEHERQEVDR